MISIEGIEVGFPGSQKEFGPHGLGLHRSADVKGRQETKGSPENSLISTLDIVLFL